MKVATRTVQARIPPSSTAATTRGQFQPDNRLDLRPLSVVDQIVRRVAEHPRIWRAENPSARCRPKERAFYAVARRSHLLLLHELRGVDWSFAKPLPRWRLSPVVQVLARRRSPPPLFFSFFFSYLNAAPTRHPLQRSLVAERSLDPRHCVSCIRSSSVS